MEGFRRSGVRLLGWCTSWGGGVAGSCVFALWCMGTLAMNFSIRFPQVAAADKEQGGEEETAEAAGALGPDLRADMRRASNARCRCQRARAALRETDLEFQPHPASHINWFTT